VAALLLLILQGRCGRTALKEAPTSVSKDIKMNMKRLIGPCLVAALASAVAVSLAYGPRASADQDSHKVTICHGTASAKNPYVMITVDESALKGHFDGTAPGHGKNNYPDKYPVNGACSVDDGGGHPS
jgi:hypothetical protein